MERVREERQVGVDVRVDEARRDDPAGDVEPPPRLGAAERADRRDAVAPDPDVRAEPRAPGAVHHTTACQHEIEHERSSFARGCPLGRFAGGARSAIVEGGRRSRMEALYRPMAVLIDQPWLAAIPGAVLLALWPAVRRRLVLAALGAVSALRALGRPRR